MDRPHPLGRSRRATGRRLRAPACRQVLSSAGVRGRRRGAAAPGGHRFPPYLVGATRRRRSDAGRVVRLRAVAARRMGGCAGAGRPPGSAGGGARRVPVSHGDVAGAHRHAPTHRRCRRRTIAGAVRKCAQRNGGAVDPPSSVVRSGRSHRRAAAPVRRRPVDVVGVDRSPAHAVGRRSPRRSAPGYRPLLDPPRGALDRWMVEEVLAASSPRLDAAEAGLSEVSEVNTRGVTRSILAAIAEGNRSFANMARVAGVGTGALSRPLAALERAGWVVRIVDPLRSKRDTYDLADSHLRFWLSVIAPHRSSLQAGRAADVWARVREATWPSQVLGPRWERVVRQRLADLLVEDGRSTAAAAVVGATVVADPSARTSHEVDLVAVQGGRVVAIGEAKLRPLGRADVARLERIRGLPRRAGRPTGAGLGRGVRARHAHARGAARHARRRLRRPQARRRVTDVRAQPSRPWRRLGALRRQASARISPSSASSAEARVTRTPLRRLPHHSSA